MFLRCTSFAMGKSIFFSSTSLSLSLPPSLFFSNHKSRNCCLLYICSHATVKPLPSARWFNRSFLFIEYALLIFVQSSARMADLLTASPSAHAIDPMRCTPAFRQSAHVFFVFAIYVISLVFCIIILKHWVKMGLLCIIFHIYSLFAEYKILALVFKKILTLSFTIHPVGHSSCNIKIFLMIFFWNTIYCIYLTACVDSFILFFWTFLGLYLFIYLFFIFFLIWKFS